MALIETRAPDSNPPWDVPQAHGLILQTWLGEREEIEFSRRRASAELSGDVEQASAIARSINRQLSRAVRAICGHRQTLQLNWTRALRPFERPQPVLIMSAVDCPCCAVLDWWRAYVGKLMALHVLMRRGSSARTYDKSVVDGTRALLSLEPSTFAEALFSSFTWFAHKMDAHLAQIAASPSSMIHQGLPLDIHRWHIGSQGFVYSFGVERLLIAYSLTSAIAALKRSAARASSGPLWRTHQPPQVSDGAVHHDTWFIGQWTPFMLLSDSLAMRPVRTELNQPRQLELFELS